MKDVDLGETSPLVTPLYQSCVYTFPDVDALERMFAGGAGYIYARDGHPNADKLAAELARLEGAAWAQACGSGMAAVSAAVLPLVAAGDRVVLSDRLYGKTTQLLRAELNRFGVSSAAVDVTDLNAVREALRTPARFLFVESVSNPLCRIADVPSLAAAAKEQGCRLIVDNTFPTPVLLRPLELGADLVIESLTKIIAGHSDTTLGLVCGTDAELLPAVERAVSVWGLAANPFDCWLAERSLATLELRVRAATANAAALAGWLRDQPGVANVYYPGLADHPDHELGRRLMPEGVGFMLAFELAGGLDAVNRFMRAAPGVPFSPSLGHTSTTCSHPWSTSHRPDSPAAKRRQGIEEGLIRLSVGVEPVERARAELERGLRNDRN